VFTDTVTVFGLLCWGVGLFGLCLLFWWALSRTYAADSTEDPAARWRGTGWRCGWHWEWDSERDLPWPPTPGERLLATMDPYGGFLVPNHYAATITDINAREEAALLGLRPAWLGF
jgi:hypothetical protein